jgi:hypothetical protein
VDLAVYPDEDYFDAHAEIVVTSPSSEEGAKIFVTDHGRLTWMRECWGEATTSVSEPDLSGPLTDPAAIAATVVNAAPVTVIRASAPRLSAGTCRSSTLDTRSGSGSRGT